MVVVPSIVLADSLVSGVRNVAAAFQTGTLQIPDARRSIMPLPWPKPISPIRWRNARCGSWRRGLAARR